MSSVEFSLFGNNLHMFRMVFPTANGVVVHSGEKQVVSVTDCDGQKKLRSFKGKNKVIFWHFPFFRGVQYFFCGIVAQFSALILAMDMCEKQKLKTEELKRYYTKKLLSLGLVFLCGVIFAFAGLGILPGKIGFWIVGVKGVTIIRNVVILVFKLVFFLLFLLVLRLFPVMNEFFSFNRAGDVALILGDFNRNKKTKCPARALNFVNFLIFVFVLDFVVITLIGASFGFWFNLLFHIVILLLCTSFGFEILFLLDLCKVKWMKNLAFATECFVANKPTTTHIETAMTALTEINLLENQKGREFMDEQSHAFSVVYNEVRNKLLAAGVTDKSDADWLVATVLGKNRAEMKLVSSVTDKQYQDIMQAAKRRARGESLDNIFGFTEFYGLRFDVNKKVLTPRMETEILVENVIKALKNFKKPEVLDLGTGSGAIAIAVAKNSEAVVTAVDVSKSALVTAQNNAQKNGVKIEFLHSNLFENLKKKRKFDIIVSNPPYIKSGDIPKLDRNVRECDPTLALDGGEDGLDFYRAIIPASVKRLNGGGMLFFEIGKGQGKDVRKLMRDAGFEDVKTIKDYNKIERVICGRIK